MRQFKNIPRIIKITKVKGYKIHCAFNNGEHRIIDFEYLFKKWKSKKNDFEYALKDLKSFKKVEIRQGTLCWPHIKKKIQLSERKEMDIYLDFDPVVLYENSVSDEKLNKRYEIGHVLKRAREEAGLTQEELATRSGTTKNYISRIENNRSDIELRTLRKIIEIGLGKNLEIEVN